eukprot:5795335-Pleurochrysis_carterae.AAC.1
MTQRMLGAQSRESICAFRKQLASMRAANWQELENVKKQEKQTEADLRQLRQALIAPALHVNASAASRECKGYTSIMSVSVV